MLQLTPFCTVPNCNSNFKCKILASYSYYMCASCFATHSTPAPPFHAGSDSVAGASQGVLLLFYPPLISMCAHGLTGRWQSKLPSCQIKTAADRNVGLLYDNVAAGKLLVFVQSYANNQETFGGFYLKLVILFATKMFT